jgi:hypothetical protein
MTVSESQARDVDAMIAALSASTFLSDADRPGAATALRLFYNKWAPAGVCHKEADMALISSLFTLVVELAEDSDVFRAMTVNLVGSDG